MSELSLAQQYMMLASDPAVRRLVPTVKQVMQTYACGAGIAELLLEGRLRLQEDGTFVLTGAAANDGSHFVGYAATGSTADGEANDGEAADGNKTVGSPGAALLLAQCQSSARPKTMRKWIHDLYAHRRFRAPFCAAEIGPLLESGLMREERRRLLLVFPAVRHIPDPSAVRAIVQRIRSDMLGQPTAADKTALLVMLLDASRLLKAYFTPVELEALRGKLKALQERPGERWNIVRQTRRAIDEIHVVIVTTAGM